MNLPVRPLVATVLIVSSASFLAAQPTPDWVERDGHREAALTIPDEGKTGFTLLSAVERGILHTNQLPISVAAKNQNLLSGGGVAVGDYDGDGFPDLFFANLAGPARLYRNLGDFKFEDATEAAGIDTSGMHTTGALFADLDGDGRLDLYVNSNNGPNAFYHNLGDGRFEDRTEAAGLALDRLGGTSLASGDLNGDGINDLLVANYGENTILRGGGDVRFGTDRSGRTIIRGRHSRRLVLTEEGFLTELGDTNLFYLGRGNGVFEAIPWPNERFLDHAGKPHPTAPLDLTLSVMIRDINQDGHLDVYECSDFQTPDRVWINDGRGTFREISPLAVRSFSVFSMGVTFADINHDGWDDFLVCDMDSRDHGLRMRQMVETNRLEAIGDLIAQPQIRRNTLYLNRGDGTYAEIADFAGLDRTDWTWTPLFLDVDLDGWEDLLVSNGHAYDTQDHDGIERVRKMPSSTGMDGELRLGAFPLLRTPNFAFRNRRDLTFEEKGAEWGFESLRVTHGLVQVDLDLDGDLDLVGSCLNASPLIYRNDTVAPRVSVRLRGPINNVQGIGAKIALRGGAVPIQRREIISGGPYLSGSDTTATFAVGEQPGPMSLEVVWPGGKVSRIENVKANHAYEIFESGSAPGTGFTPPRFTGEPLFANVSDRLNHQHAEEPFDDFQRQPLLPKKLSQPGPGVTWADLDGDANEDLIITGGQGFSMGVFKNRGDGQFSRLQSDLLDNPNLRDQTAALVLNTGARELLVANSNYEDGLDIGPAISRYRADGDGLTPLNDLPAWNSSVGGLAAADIDGTGNWRLFAAGRVIPGNYPLPAASRMYRRDGEDWVPDEANSELLENIGMVNGAIFTDLDADGTPELVLACEWSSVKILAFVDGRLTDRTEESGLADRIGWWSGVTAGDFNNDGLIDLAVGNWGLNGGYQASDDNRIHLAFADLNRDGWQNLIEGYENPSFPGKIMPRLGRPFLEKANPLLKIRFPTHLAYSTAPVPDLVGPLYARLGKLAANELRSMVLLNRGGLKFSAQPLPTEAQFSNVWGMNTADFDGDGQLDVFLAQNHFATSTTLPRLDGGRGLLLKGLGDGRFTPVPGQESGIKVYGEQRGSAAGDFNRDGRPDLVVSQNGTATQLFVNERGKPGVRVVLEGPPQNPDGIGAQIALLEGDKPRALQEVRAGSGFLSQDSRVLIVHPTTENARLRVRWPGGKTTDTPVPARTGEVSVKWTP